MTNNGLQPTNAAEWRKPREEGELITLPSGNVARLRPVALDVLLTSGGIPDLLTPIAAKTLWVETEPEQIGNVGELAEGFAKLVNVIIPAAFMEPAVVEEPKGDGEISLDDIDWSDKVYVFNLVTAGPYAMRKFREQQTRNVEPVRNRKNSRSKSK
ncbi:MAG TPA: hypothetical protein VKA67_10080 [Verrucomicrobiae bacterium]|nr:hypothetical protein [Verrucomicrobiae bacterium]